MKKTVLSFTVAAALLTGCAQQDGETAEPAAGSNRPTATAEPAETTAPETTAPVEDMTLAFGEAFTYENNVQVMVGPPQEFQPGEYASKDEAPAYVSFDVTIVNNSTEVYDPAVFSATVQSANVEAGTVFSSEQGFDGAPSTAVLPGRETKFKLGYGVQNPADIVMDLAPGYDYQNIYYTTSGG